MVEPDYFQFYARRSGASWASDQVSQDGRAARLWTDGQFVYVHTSRKFGPTPVEVTIHTARPDDPDLSWQHVAEVSLAPGGPLEILHWDSLYEPAAVIELPPDDVRLRVSWQGMVKGQHEGMDHDGHSDERLSFELWPAPPEPPRVVRRWSGWPW